MFYTPDRIANIIRDTLESNIVNPPYTINFLLFITKDEIIKMDCTVTWSENQESTNIFNNMDR